MPHQQRLMQRRRASQRRSRQRRALRNRRLRRNGRLNRMFGPQRRSTLIERGLPVYSFDALLLPPIPVPVSRSNFDNSIAHDVERNSQRYYEHWLGCREVVGDIMEYQFRRRFCIPIHLPRSVMKEIFLYLGDEEDNVNFGGEGCFIEPLLIETFTWPRPFRWPLFPRR